MAHLLEIVVMGRACRNAAGLKNRQPLFQNAGEEFLGAFRFLSDHHRG